MHQAQLLKSIKTTSLLDLVLEYWLGRKPLDNEQVLLQEMMSLVIDHGPDSPSAKATIAATQSGQDLLRSVEAGVCEINAQHGGAIEGCGKILQSDSRPAADIVREALAEDKRLPGFGHRLYKDFDPRTQYLFTRAKELGFSDTYINKAKNIEIELEKQKGTKLVINIDGAMAAILCELKVEPRLMNGFFLWPRVAGLIYQFKLKGIT